MHGLYKEPNLPYLNVKCCPDCEALLPLDTLKCPKCNYNFSSMNFDDPISIKKNKEETPVVVPVAPVEPVVEQPKVEVPVEPVPEEPTKEEEPVQQQLDLEPEVKEEPVPEEPIKEEPIKEEVKEAPVEEKKEKAIFCDRCGSKIIGAQKFCGGCGAKISKTICPTCGEIIDNNLVYCPFCGTKQQNVVVEPMEEKPVQPQPQVQQYYQPQPQPVIINVTNQTAPQPVAVDKEVEGPQTVENIAMEEPSEEPTPTEVVAAEVGDTLAEDYVNMGRKRLFIIIQLIITVLIVAVMIMMPIITENFLFANIASFFNGTAHETVFSGKDFAKSLLSLFGSGLVIDPKNVSLVSASGNFYVFTSLPTIKTILGLLPGSISNAQVIGAYFAILSVYLVIILASILVIITSILGMINRKPFKGNALGLLVWMLVYGCVIVYIGKFFAKGQGFPEFANADSWLIYAFALAFILWFVIKLVFFRETKIYNKKKEIETNQRIMHEH